MIESAEEFVQLRDKNHSRASHDIAEIQVWLNIVWDYPEYKKWVIRNKTIPIEILEFLSKDPDAKIRAEVARKRKINESIFLRLSVDENVDVRFALMTNTKLSAEEKKTIFIEDSEWLKNEIKKINASR